MDIIAAHRQGLIEQLDDEVAALAGRSRDHAQRAIVLHHLYDHSGGQHRWALSEARRALHIAAALETLRRRLDRWVWLGGDRDRARAALELLAEAIGRAVQLRAAAAYRSYRLSATRALRDAAEDRLDPALLDLLDQCHQARRAGLTLSPEMHQALAEECERDAAAAIDSRALDEAWAAIEASGLRRAAKRLLGDKALVRLAANDLRRGAVRVERELRTSPMLPPAFRANPAQHFYALQRMMHERRRQQWRELCDQVPDAFELAA